MTPTEEIIKIRDTFGMSSRKMAEAIGVSYNTIRAYFTRNEFGEIHVERLKHFIISEAEKLKK